jgi:hypothetical protein
MEGRVAFFHRDKGSKTGRREFLASIGCDRECLRLNHRTIVPHLGGARLQYYLLTRGSGRPELHMKLSGNGAGRSRKARALHQRVRRGPVRVTIQERTHDAPVQHSGERFVMGLGMELRRDASVRLDKTTDSQALRVSGAASKANAVRCMGLLQAFHTRGQAYHV